LLLTSEREANTDPDSNAIISAKSWSYVRFLSSTEIHFAAQITFSFAFILLICVFVSEVQNLHFVWTLYTIVFTASPTMGGNVFNSIYRVFGTVLGGLYGAVAWYASTGNPFGVVAMSLPVVFIGAYFKACTTHPKLGAQILIAFTIILYDKYGASVTGAIVDTAIILAAERIVNMVIGVLAILIASRLLYPYVARTELRKRLGITLEDLGHLHTQLIAIFRDPQALTGDVGKAKLTSLSTAIRISQRDLNKAKTLLAQTVNEPKLRKGTFERETFEKLIGTSQHLLDLLVTSRSILIQSHNPALLAQNDYFRSRIFAPAHKERLQNLALVDLSFYVLASAMRSKRPLPYYLPQTCAASSLLIQKLGAIVEQERDSEEQAAISSHVLLNYFAFLCSVHMVTIDLVRATSLVRRIAGVNNALKRTSPKEKSVF